MPNTKLAEVAINAVYHGNWEYPVASMRCQMFVRECIETAHGEKYSEAVRANSAKEAVGLWKARGWGFPASELSKHGGLKQGDCLYKTSGPYGHVGIAVRRNGQWFVAENSSTQVGRIRGALGFRTLSQFGAFDYVGRLPESVTGESIEANPAVGGEAEESFWVYAKTTGKVDGAFIRDKEMYAPVRDVLKLAGYKVTKVTDNRAKDGKFHVKAIAEK